MSDITRDYSFGGWLRHIRIERRLTLRKAAEVLHMDPGNLSKMERSELAPPKSATRIAHICALLGAPTAREVLISTAYQHHLSALKSEFEDRK